MKSVIGLLWSNTDSVQPGWWSISKRETERDGERGPITFKLCRLLLCIDNTPPQSSMCSRCSTANCMCMVRNEEVSLRGFIGLSWHNIRRITIMYMFSPHKKKNFYSPFLTESHFKKIRLIFRKAYWILSYQYIFLLFQFCPQLLKYWKKIKKKTYEECNFRKSNQKNRLLLK